MAKIKLNYYDSDQAKIKGVKEYERNYTNESN